MPAATWQTVVVLAASYLIGALPFGYLVARARGVNIFAHGSGNIGATNIGRVLGRRFGILVFLLDFCKGAAPVAAAGWLAGKFDSPPAGWPSRDGLMVGAGLAAFLGHLFPVYLRFRGGKGVATGAGVVAVLVPWPALAAFVAWLAVFTATRYMSAASLFAVAVLCLARVGGSAAPAVADALGAGLTADPFARDHEVATAFCFVAAALVALRHRSNLGRLLRGTENRFQETRTMLLLSRTVHVLAVGLWFGTAVFFLVATAAVFHAFGSLAEPGPGKPAWLPLPESVTTDQAARLAGVAIGPLFDWYFPIQFGCGLLAVVTALAWAWSPSAGTADRARAAVLGLAFVGVVVGWSMARHINRLRYDRYAAEETAAANAADGAAKAAADEARAAFGRWHGYSFLLNFVTLILVAIGAALAAQLPGGTGPGNQPAAGQEGPPNTATGEHLLAGDREGAG